MSLSVCLGGVGGGGGGGVGVLGHLVVVVVAAAAAVFGSVAVSVDVLVVAKNPAAVVVVMAVEPKALNPKPQTPELPGMPVSCGHPPSDYLTCPVSNRRS